MALPETPVQEKAPSEGHKHERREKPPTKVIVRRLPPTMTSQEFLTQVSPIRDYDYMYAVKGDMSLGENAFSRVYINYCNTEDIFLFQEKFDNYVVVDAKGHAYAAVVEFASFQKIPKKRGKPRPDPKLASIESDPTYIEFVESLKRQPNQDEKVEFSYQPSSENKNEASTPLLDCIKQREIDRLKSREEKREERRRREIERKKLRDEEKRKRFEENSPTKSITIKQSKGDLEKISEEKKTKDEERSPEKYEKSPYKTKDFKPGAKPKPKYQKYEYEKRDYKSRSSYNRPYEDTRKKDEAKKSADETKLNTPNSTKKVKKYSEKREERKLEVRKAEQKKDETDKEVEPKTKETQDENKHSKTKEVEEVRTKEENEKKISRDDREDSKSGDQEKIKNKENDPRVQRRIRNEDRPTMQLYQPGMLSKRKHQEDDKDVKEQNKD